VCQDIEGERGRRRRRRRFDQEKKGTGRNEEVGYEEEVQNEEE
jgi:hypothetical protein